MNKSNPVGTGSFSINRHPTTTAGDYSISLGYMSTTSGNYSYTEGYNTKTYGNGAHAEGWSTIARSNASHAQGVYNIDDTAMKYAHIVGNGASYTERSNAHTLDWNGVGWYQGGLQVGGNAQDDGACYVLLEGDAIPVPETATVGQTIVVKSVDDAGKPTEWECVDMPESVTDEQISSAVADYLAENPIDGSDAVDYVVQDTAPEDTSVLWVDTSDNSDDGFQEAVNVALAQAKESGEFDGADGDNGVSCTHSWNGTTLTVTSASGTSSADLKGADGYTPVKGTDYYTEEEKAEFVNEVLSALPTWTGGSY